MKTILFCTLSMLCITSYAQSDTTLKKYALVYTPEPAWDTAKPSLR